MTQYLPSPSSVIFLNTRGEDGHSWLSLDNKCLKRKSLTHPVSPFPTLCLTSLVLHLSVAWVVGLWLLILYTPGKCSWDLVLVLWLNASPLLSPDTHSTSLLPPPSSPLPSALPSSPLLLFALPSTHGHAYTFTLHGHFLFTGEAERK